VVSPQGALQPLPGAPRLYATIPIWPYGVPVDGLPVLDDLLEAWKPPGPEWFIASTYGFNLAGNEVNLIKQSPPQADWLIYPLNHSRLSARVVHPPLSTEVRLRVEAGGSGLNVRRLPGVSYELLGTLRDGAVVTVTSSTQEEVRGHCGSQAFGCSVLQAMDGDITFETPHWLHVRSADGLEGWVNAEYLVWAD
jgi:hypothetical protein